MRVASRRSCLSKMRFRAPPVVAQVRANQFQRHGLPAAQAQPLTVALDNAAQPAPGKALETQIVPPAMLVRQRKTHRHLAGANAALAIALLRLFAHHETHGRMPIHDLNEKS